MSRVARYANAKETLASGAELILDFDPPNFMEWFSHTKPEDLISIQWFSRNVANCAFSMKTLMKTEDNSKVYAEWGIPRSAKRLKGLLQYFLWVLEHIIYREFGLVSDKKQDNIQNAWMLTAVWTAYLRNSLEDIDEWIESKTEPYSFDSPKPTSIPAETMHELLGSFYIWTRLKVPTKGEELKQPDNVGLLLREMMFNPTQLDRETLIKIIRNLSRTADDQTESDTKKPDDQKDSGVNNVLVKIEEYNSPTDDFYSGQMKWGLSECIFTTQKDQDPETLLIGSSKAHYPASTPVQSKSKDSGNKNNTLFFDVDDVFKKMRTERMGGETEKELRDRFRENDYEYMSPMISVVQSMRDYRLSVDGGSKALVDFYIQQRQRTTPDWRSFDHEDQKAKSFYVLVNTNGKEKEPSPQFFFVAVPRCGKCRTITSYSIPDLETPQTMDNYLAINPPLVCAEDIVHAKLQKLRKLLDIPDRGRITVDPNELTLTQKDDQRQNLDTNPAKNSAEYPPQNYNVQKKAVFSLQLRDSRNEATEALQRLEKELTIVREMELEEKRAMSKSPTHTANKKKLMEEQKIHILNVKKAQKFRKVLVEQVHEYLKLKKPAGTGMRKPESKESETKEPETKEPEENSH